MIITKWKDNHGNTKYTIKYGDDVRTFSSENEANDFRLAKEREILDIGNF